MFLFREEISIFFLTSDRSNEQNTTSKKQNIPSTNQNTFPNEQTASSSNEQASGNSPDVRKLKKSGSGHRKKGEAHGNWKGGDSRTRDYDPLKYSAWKETVLRRHNFRYIVTGATKDLACHHINSWDWCVEGRYDEQNGVVLTKEIHLKFHKIYAEGKEKIHVNNFNFFYLQTLILL